LAENKNLGKIVGDAIGIGSLVELTGGAFVSIINDEKYSHSLTNPYLLTFVAGCTVTILAPKLYQYFKNKPEKP